MEALFFRTQFTPRKRITACAGSPIKIVFGSYLDKHGNVHVKEKGQEDLSEYINSFKDSCDLSVILTRFLHGDENALKQKEALFMDLTEIPTNYNDFANQFNDARDLFDKLPIDIKKKFDNDINKFYCNVGTDDWFGKLGIGKPAAANDNSNTLAVSPENLEVVNEQKSE